ncbi:unnamed protein product [Linum trigynum]|uniref:Uncharacterized protein n=1 Tax=Linum trigynum TaxID=586398 RepID=A0AAV2G2M1_9ROSI
MKRRSFDDNGNDQSKRLRQMGVSDVGVRVNEELESDCSDEFEESDGDGRDDDDDDEKSFKVLDSFKRDREQKQETMRIELGEHELRHPLVRKSAG